MKFSDRVLRRIGKEGFPLLANWIAENPSLQPTIEIEFPDHQWLPHFSRAKEGILAYILSLYLPFWHTDKLVTRLRDSCYFHQYEGEWAKLQDLLEQVPDLPTFEENFTDYFSENDFFGNIIPEMEIFLRRNRFNKTFHAYENDRRKAKRPIRYRGYRDKGTLRPYHRRGRNLPDPNPQKDRRNRISHPMYSSQEKRKNLNAEELVLTARFSERRKEY